MKKTMKAAVLTVSGKIEIQEMEIPSIRKNEVLVKLKYCGICTLEQRLYSGEMKTFYPIIPGHEASGKIVEKGTEVVSGIKPGLRVALDLVTRCGECYFCRTGRINIYTSYNNRTPLPVDANTLHRREQLISSLTTFDTLENGLKAAMSKDTYRILPDHEAS